MNKKDIVIKENIEAVAKFLEETTAYLVESKEGSCNFTFAGDQDVALYVGWAGGHAADEETSIHLDSDPTYALEAAIKVRQDTDKLDYEVFGYPRYVADENATEQAEEVFDTTAVLTPEMTKKEYSDMAKKFLEEYVNLVNAHNKGDITYE